MPRLRHVFLDNLFGNINHRERHEMLEGVRASERRGSMHGERHASCPLSALSQENAASTASGSSISRFSREWCVPLPLLCVRVVLYSWRGTIEIVSLFLYLSLSRARVTISRFLSWNWLSYCFWVFLKTIFIRILDSLFDNLPKLPEGSGKIQQCEKELRESLCHAINSDWGTIRRV